MDLVQFKKKQVSKDQQAQISGGLEASASVALVLAVSNTFWSHFNRFRREGDSYTMAGHAAAGELIATFGFFTLRLVKNHWLFSVPKRFVSW